MNLEMAVTEEMLDIARAVRPADVCFVPEKRQEVTTEGGLDAAGQVQRLKEATAILVAQSIRVALFVDPDDRQIEAAVQIGAPVVELHTGAYAGSAGARQAEELRRLQAAAQLGTKLGLEMHAGHGLNYHNVQPIAAIEELVELNIGHAIVAHALLVGLPTALREMRALMVAARGR